MNFIYAISSILLASVLASSLPSGMSTNELYPHHKSKLKQLIKRDHAKGKCFHFGCVPLGKHRNTEVSEQQFFTANGKWDDEKFMSSYKCNPTHSYSKETFPQSERIQLLIGFLAPGEAEHLKHISLPLMERSKVQVGKEIKESPARTSSTAMLKQNYDKVIKCIKKRVSKLSGYSTQSIGPFFVNRYQNGQEFKPHHDALKETSNKRIISMFAYLNDVDPENGGHTYFPKLDIKVPAIKNNVLMWYNYDSEGNRDVLMEHGGAPVENAEKFGANILVFEKRFQTKI